MKILLTSMLVLSIYISHTFYQSKPLSESLADGKEIYHDFCMQCHLTNGQGVSGSFPPLANSDFLSDQTRTIQALKFGLSGPINVNGTTYNGQMATQGLDNEEIADVLNYVYRQWGNETEHIFTENEIATTQPK